MLHKASCQTSTKKINLKVEIFDSMSTFAFCSLYFHKLGLLIIKCILSSKVEMEQSVSTRLEQDILPENCNNKCMLPIFK